MCAWQITQSHKEKKNKNNAAFMLLISKLSINGTHTFLICFFFFFISFYIWWVCFLFMCHNQYTHLSWTFGIRGELFHTQFRLMWHLHFNVVCDACMGSLSLSLSAHAHMIVASTLGEQQNQKNMSQRVEHKQQLNEKKNRTLDKKKNIESV